MSRYYIIAYNGIWIAEDPLKMGRAFSFKTALYRRDAVKFDDLGYANTVYLKLLEMVPPRANLKVIHVPERRVP